MHIKTNIEHSSVQIIVLAICPLLMVVSTINQAIFYMSGTILCLLVSQIFITIFNRFLNNNVKTMLTALISALIVTASMILVKEYTNKVMPETSYFIIFSTVILNAEFVYFRNKAVMRHYFFSILKIIFIYALLGFVYATIKEFTSFGTLFDYRLLNFDGFKFCSTMMFDLVLLALLCAVFDYVVRIIDKVHETKSMVYQKYVKIIRDQKAFQYDRLRREKLLANEIEINRLSRADAEKLRQKVAENESIESVQEAVNDSEEIMVEPVEDGETVENKEEVAKPVEEKETKKRGKKGKKGGK